MEYSESNVGVTIVGARKRKQCRGVVVLDDKSYSKPFSPQPESPSDSGYKEDEALEDKKSSDGSEIPSSSHCSTPKTETENHIPLSRIRTSNRIKQIKRDNELISLLNPTDRKLIKAIKKSGKLKRNEDLEDARDKWLPFVALTRLKPLTIFRLTDDWSFLENFNIVKSITFIPHVKEQRYLKAKSVRESFVTWRLGRYNNFTTDIGPVSKISQPPDDFIRQCLESLRNPTADEGSWIETDKVSALADGFTVDVQNLPWDQKMVHRDQLITKRQTLR